jgi:hypothetical protein
LMPLTHTKLEPYNRLDWWFIFPLFVTNCAPPTLVL